MFSSEFDTLQESYISENAIILKKEVLIIEFNPLNS